MTDRPGIPDEAPAPGPINAAGVVYGVLAVATVIAAESTRRETFGKLLAASAVTMGLYWLAHAYAHHWASRLGKAREWTVAEIVTSLAHEASILVGALVPAAVLAISWLAGVGIRTAVTAVLWTAGIEIVVLEVGAGLRHHLRLADMAVQSLIGVAMGLGILGVRVLLH
ncbi:MAG TPA: hypothetical protein VFH58_04935 [Acidimicrobiales bacterium]|nr:hypothetical protein [Acidimicrobiales bacterium]